MKNFRIFLFFLILSFSNSNVVADMPHYLDFKYILNNSTAGKKVQDSLQKKLKDGISSLNKKEKSLQEEEKKMIQQKKVISQEEYVKKVNNLRKKVSSLQVERNSLLEKISKDRNKARNELLKNLNPIIENYMQEKKIRLVIDKKNIILADEKLDITKEIMQIALAQAKDGRMHILGEMKAAINSAREDVSNNAPRIITFQIAREKIREVIGTGGKVIREICETTGAKVDIEDDGTIKVASVDTDAGQKAIDWIQSIVAEPEVGTIYEGKVVKIVDFGAFVNFLGSKDGLVHISELANERVPSVGDVVSEGQTVKVLVLAVDGRGKVKLSMRAVDQETGEEIPVERKEREPRRERGPRRD